MPRDEKLAKELALIVRPLAVVLCLGYSINLILLVAGLALAIGVPDALNPESNSEKYTHQLVSRVNFALQSTGAFVGSITSALLITATYTRHYWLILPCLMKHALLFLYCFSSFTQSLVFKSYGVEDLGDFMLNKNGSYGLTAGVLLMCLLAYSFFPLWSFFKECQLIWEWRNKVDPDAEEDEVRTVQPIEEVQSQQARQAQFQPRHSQFQPQQAQFQPQPMKYEYEWPTSQAAYIQPRKSMQYQDRADRHSVDRRHSHHHHHR